MVLRCIFVLFYVVFSDFRAKIKRHFVNVAVNGLFIAFYALIIAAVGVVRVGCGCGGAGVGGCGAGA